VKERKRPRRGKPLIGFLCGSLAPDIRDLLNRLRSFPDFSIKAYPLLHRPYDYPAIEFDYRPTNLKGRFITFSKPDKTSPESTLLSVSWATVWSLVREADIIVLMGIQSLPAILTTILARLFRKPMVVVSQTMRPEIERSRLALIRVLKYIVLRNAAVHVAQTPPTHETLCLVYHVNKAKIFFAPFEAGGGIFKDFYTHMTEDRLSLRERLGLNAGSIIFLFVGTLIYLKGVDILLDSVAKLAEKHDNIKLLIVGPDGKAGGQRAVLEDRVHALGLKEYVQFLGKKQPRELARIYKASDVFVLPTRKDTWGRVLLEAALAGLPLITTSVCGAAGYLVQNNVNGFIVPPNDPGKLAQAMEQLLNPELRIEMGKKSIQIAEDYVNPNAEVEGFVAALRHAITLNSKWKGRQS